MDGTGSFRIDMAPKWASKDYHVRLLILSVGGICASDAYFIISSGVIIGCKLYTICHIALTSRKARGSV